MKSDPTLSDSVWTIHVCEDHRALDCAICGVHDVVTVVPEADRDRWKGLAQQWYDGIEEQGAAMRRLYDALLDVRTEATHSSAGWVLSNDTFEKVRKAIEGEDVA